jgi:hypothetical protein
MGVRFRWSITAVVTLLVAGCSTDTRSPDGILRGLPTRVTCTRGDDIQVNVGAKWCHAGAFRMCQGNGTWLATKATCNGGTRGVSRAPTRIVSKNTP